MAGLNCERHGGPNKIAAQEMVYWEDILSDNKYTSPFHPQQQHPKGEDGQTDISQYMTFEPDQGGWNNIQMAMETVLVSSSDLKQ